MQGEAGLAPAHLNWLLRLFYNVIIQTIHQNALLRMLLSYIFVFRHHKVKHYIYYMQILFYIYLKYILHFICTSQTLSLIL